MSANGITVALAKWVSELQGSDIPQETRKEGVRSFVNWLGCAVGGTNHETADRHLQQ